MTDQDRLIEAVARAMCESMGIDPDDLDPMVICDKENNPLPLWQYYDDVAAAAILATLRGIREPSEEIGRAGFDELFGKSIYCRDDGWHTVAVETTAGKDMWRVMIDRLIQEFAPEGKGE